VDTAAAAEIAEQALNLSTALEVERLLQRELHRRFPRLSRVVFKVTGAGGE